MRQYESRPSVQGCRGLRRSTRDASSSGPSSYRGRNVVERHFTLIKQWRGLSTRYDKLAITYRAAVILAACITWSRIGDTP